MVILFVSNDRHGTKEVFYHICHVSMPPSAKKVVSDNRILDQQNLKKSEKRCPTMGLIFCEGGHTNVTNTVNVSTAVINGCSESLFRSKFFKNLI